MANPYEPPQASPKPAPPPGWIRWRVIPAALLTIFGGLEILMGLAIMVWSLVRPADSPYQLGSTRWFGVLAIGMSGTLWVAAGLGFWERRW